MKPTFVVLKIQKFYKNSVDFCYFIQPFFHKNFRGTCSSVEMLKGEHSQGKGWELLLYRDLLLAA